MAEADPLRKYVEAGIAFTQLTKARAEAMVRELVKAGDVQREQAQDRVEELLDRSRKSTEGLVGIVRREVAHQLSSMGFATKEDVDDLEARVESRLASMAQQPQAPVAKQALAAKPSKPAKASRAVKASEPPVAPKVAGPAAKRARPTGTSTRVGKASASPPPGPAARKASASPSRRKPASPGGGA